jgi:hypothetical protein
VREFGENSLPDTSILPNENFFVHVHVPNSFSLAVEMLVWHSWSYRLDSDYISGKGKQ